MDTEVQTFGHDDRAQWTPLRSLDQLRDGIGHALGARGIGLVLSIIGVGLDLTRDRRDLAVGRKHGLVGWLRARGDEIAREWSWLDNDGVDSKALQFVPIGFRKSLERELASRVGAEERKDHPTHQGCHMNEEPATSSTHMRQHGAVCPHGTKEIHRKQPLDVRNCVGFGDPDGHQSGIVDQHIDFSMLLDDLIDRGVHRGLVGDVHFKDLQPMSLGFRRVDKVLSDLGISSLNVPHCRNHRMTPPCEFQYREVSETTARTGDYNDFSAHLKFSLFKFHWSRPTDIQTCMYLQSKNLQTSLSCVSEESEVTKMQRRSVLDFVDVDGQSLEALAPRERILKTASDLFYRLSINAVGIDRIIAESGVAKMTFYKHFPSKATLIATYLRHKRVIWFQMLATATEKPGLSSKERVLAIFDAIDEPLRAKTFRGCTFARGLAEFGPEANTPEVQATIAEYFTELHEFVASLIEPLALENPERAVIQILSLVQGSFVMAQSIPNGGIVEANRDAARLLLEHGLPD